jgi:hypothetical protein
MTSGAPTATELAPTLLAIPEPCLLAVLQCCAAVDPRSLFNAARAHSRLYKAVTSLQSITIKIAKHTTRAQQQRQLNRALLYLSKHGKHIGSLILFGQQGNAAILRQLPPILQPTSLQLEGCCLQLQPSRSIWYSRNFRGLLGAAAGVAALKQLQISNCSVVDGSTGLAAAVAELPAGLEQLGLNSVSFKDAGSACFPTAALQQLQQLTYLELVGVRFQSPDPEAQALEPLQALTRLGDVHIHPVLGKERVSSHTASLPACCQAHAT